MIYIYLYCGMFHSGSFDLNPPVSIFSIIQDPNGLLRSTIRKHNMNQLVLLGGVDL